MKMLAPAAFIAAITWAGVAKAQDRPSPKSSVAPKAMQAIAPGLAVYTDEVLFGDVWVRPELPPRDRSLVTLSALVATGKSAQMTSHLNIGLTNGLEPATISGMVTQLAFYTGWPNAVSALGVIEEVFNARKINLVALRTAVSRPPAPVVATPRAPNAGMLALAPKFEALTADTIYGDLWRRSDLSPRDRSLVTIIALAANGDETQLASHIKRGFSNGLSRADLIEALTHLAFYAGWPKANSAIRLVGEAGGSSTAAAPTAPRLTVTLPGTDPAAGPASNFTGAVTAASRFKGTGASRMGGATVSFAPGARTNWHTHPVGQLLVITAGRGWVQADGEAARSIGPGDVVWTGPGVRHWHGATRATPMTHTAIAEALNGESVTWMEPVTDAQYRGPR